jgi:hypothetical protein
MNEILKWFFIVYSSTICLFLGQANFTGKRFLEFSNTASRAVGSRGLGYNHHYHK